MPRPNHQTANQDLVDLCTPCYLEAGYTYDTEAAKPSYDDDLYLCYNCSATLTEVEDGTVEGI